MLNGRRAGRRRERGRVPQGGRSGAQRNRKDKQFTDDGRSSDPQHSRRSDRRTDRLIVVMYSKAIMSELTALDVSAES